MEKVTIKIVMLQDFYGIGCQYQENLLTKMYISMGFSVTVISSTFDSVFDYIADDYNRDTPASEVNDEGAKIIRLPYSLNIINKLKRHKGVYEILEKEKPDLIYVHDIHLNLREVVKYVKRFSSCKIILDYHADSSNSANHWLSLPVLHKLIRKRFLHKYLRFIDRVFPVTPGSVHFLSTVYKIPLEKMELLPLGCDYDKCKRALLETNVKEKRNALGIGVSDLVILTGGKFNNKKRTEVAIEAVKKLNMPGVHLIVFGGPQKGYEEYAKSLFALGDVNNIHFTGYVSADETYELMAISDIALYPSSQSVLWQQSIGMHLPLVAGDSGGQDMEYLNRYQNLIKIEGENINVDFVSELLYELVTNRSLIDQMKSGAVKTAETFLDYRVIASRTLEVLDL